MEKKVDTSSGNTDGSSVASQSVQGSATPREQCPQFPHFGAHYPDAQCNDGLLWDLDSYEDGFLTCGGNDPCPFCNTESYLEWAGVDSQDEDAITREEVLAHIEWLKERYGTKPNNQQNDAASVTTGDAQRTEAGN
jgi:hypothetical protein